MRLNGIFSFIIICFVLVGDMLADTLKNGGFEAGDLSSWKAETHALDIYASTRETYTRNYAARLHGTYSSESVITNRLRQSIRASAGDSIVAEGFVYWRQYTQRMDTAYADLSIRLQGAFGEQLVSWNAPHNDWTYFALTGSLFGVSQGSFEGGTTAGWIESPDKLCVSVTTNRACEGQYGCRFQGEWEGWNFSYIKQYTTVTGAVTLEARTRVYIADLVTDGDWISVGMELKRDGGGPREEITLGPEYAGSGWVPISITLPADSVGEYCLRCFVAGGTDGSNSVADVVFDDVCLWQQNTSQESCSFVLGSDDGSSDEFLQDEFDTASVNLNTATAETFPCGMHDAEWHTQYFNCLLNEGEASLNLKLSLATCGADGTGAVTVVLENWDGEEWASVGEVELGSNSMEQLTISSERLEVGKNSFRLNCSESSGDTHEIFWDYLSLESVVSKDIVLGVQDDSDLEFQQSGYSSESLDIDVVDAASFPKELNLYTRQKQFFHCTLSDEGAEQDLLLTLRPRWSSGSGRLLIAFEFWNGEYWEEADRAAVSGDVDGELFIQAHQLQSGVNSFRLKALEGTDDTDVVTWDQIVLRTASRKTAAHDVRLVMEYSGCSGGLEHECETEVFLDCCRILGSTADVQPPEAIIEELNQSAASLAMDHNTEIEPLDYPPKKSYGYVGGSADLNFPSYAEILMPGWSFNDLRSITNEVTTTAAVIIYELSGEGDGFVEFDQFGYCDRYWSDDRYTPVDVRTNTPYFTLGTVDNSSAEFGDGPFASEHNYYVGTSLKNFPKRMSTVEGDGWPERINVIYPENYSEFGYGRDKYYTITSVTTNGSESNIKTVKINTYVTGAGVPEVNVESREYHMGWAEKEEAYGMVDYPNITYQESYAVGLRDSDKRILKDDGWYMEQLIRGCNTADPMELYTYEDGNWLEKIYHECDYMWANAGSGVRSVFDEDDVKRLDGQVSYYVGFRVGHYYEPEPGEGGYNTHLVSFHGSGYMRMTDYEAYMAGSFRPFAHDPFGLYKNHEDFPVVPKSYSHLVKAGSEEGKAWPYLNILLPFQSEDDNAVLGVGRMELHMEPDEVRDSGAYFDMHVDMWTKRDIIASNDGPLNCFAQSDMFWRGGTNINDETEAHDVDTLMIHKVDGEWITFELHNPPENVVIQSLGTFDEGDTLYFMQQDRGSDSYGFDPGGDYRKVSNFEITMLENNDLPTSIDVYINTTSSEYSDNVVVACPIHRDFSDGEHLEYSYRYRAVFAPGVHVTSPNSPDGGEGWSNEYFNIEFQATDGSHALQANLYYGTGRDDEWILVNTEGPLEVPENGVVSYAWDAGDVEPGAYYIRAEAWRVEGGKIGFDVSNTRLQINPGFSFFRPEPVLSIVQTNQFMHLGSNMGFETGNVLGWAAIGDHLNIYADGTAGCEGRYAARIHGNWSGWSWNNLQQDIPCQAGETLRVKGRLYIGDLQASGSDWVACGIKMESCALAGRTMTGVEFNVTSATGVWVNVDFTRVAPVDGYDRLVLWVGGTDCSAADVYFDRIEVITDRGTEVVTNKPAYYWRGTESVDLQNDTALRLWMASSNRGENVQFWVEDSAGYTGLFDLVDTLQLSELPQQVVIPWSRFSSLDAGSVNAIGFIHAYDEMGLWQVRSVDEPLRVTVDFLAVTNVNAMGLPHYNPGEQVEQTITIENLTGENIHLATMQLFQEYGEDRFWVDESHSPWVNSYMFKKGDVLAEGRSLHVVDGILSPSEIIVITNCYILPKGKRIDSTRHWINNDLDWFTGRNRESRAQVHVIIHDAAGACLYADSMAGWFSMDDDYDVDNDGLPDAYEAVYSGDSVSFTPSGDADRDGYSNEQERLAGTSPHDAASVPVSTIQHCDIPSLKINTCKGRIYWLERTDSLRDPLWQVVSDSETEGTDSPQILMDTEDHDSRKRYYRTGTRWHHSAWPL